MSFPVPADLVRTAADVRPLPLGELVARGASYVSTCEDVRWKVRYEMERLRVTYQTLKGYQGSQIAATDRARVVALMGAGDTTCAEMGSCFKVVMRELNTRYRRSGYLREYSQASANLHQFAHDRLSSDDQRLFGVYGYTVQSVPMA